MRRMISRLGLIFVMCGSLAAQNPSGKAVPLTAEPHHHQALANRYVRVFKVEVAPKTSTLMHHHANDYYWVGIGASHIVNAAEGQKPVPMAVTDGQTMFSPAPLTHVAENDGTTPFRNITIEVLKPKKDDPAKQAEARGVEAGHGAAVETLYLKDGVLVRDVILNPQAMLPTEKAPPRLIVAVSDIKLRDHQNMKRALDKPAGDIGWVEAGPSMLVNVGDKPAHFVMFDFQ
jgi:mannose-6-phosphate isomerase-like protein (cupin superfamily)